MQGTNKLCRPENIEENVDAILEGNQKNYKVPELWDAKTANRIVKSIEHFFEK
jgi:hypothetical protein